MMKVGNKLKKKDIKELQSKLPELPEKKQIYHYYCMECDNEWESEERLNICSYCPKCRCGDLHCTDGNGKDVEC